MLLNDMDDILGGVPDKIDIHVPNIDHAIMCSE